MFTSETQVNLRVSKSSTSIQIESTTNGLARPTDLPLADQSLTSMLRAKCWRMPWHVGRRSSKGLVMAWRRWLNPLRWWDVLEKYGKVRTNPGCSWDIARYCDIHAKSIEDIEGDLRWTRLTGQAAIRCFWTVKAYSFEPRTTKFRWGFAWMNWWSSKHRASQVFKQWFHCGKNSEHFVIVGMDFAMMWRSDMEWQWWNMMKHDETWWNTMS